MFDTNNAIKKIIGTPKKRGGKNDWDGDGIFNKKDCQPRNTMRQDKNNWRKCKKCGSTKALLQSSKGGLMCAECVTSYGYAVEGDNYVYEE